MTNIFNHLIITAPTESIANVYKLQSDALSKELPCLTKVRIHCVADPKGVRIGSGGGTLNALDYLISIIGIDKVKESKVLIIHSGGDSRRSPLHSVCGKAWSSINSTIHQYSNIFATPMALLIKELSSFCINIDIGAVVIASSDVMLDIYNGVFSPIIPSNSVSVVVVPESPLIAQNHGVLIEDLTTLVSCSKNNNSMNNQYNTSLASNYLQKPSLQVMKDLNAIKYASNTTNTNICTDSEVEGTVLIDTGVVIFTGIAYYSLLSLLDNELISLCTERGLFNYNNTGTNTTNSSYLNALRLELYSDLIISLSLSHPSPSSDNSSKSNSDLSSYFTRLGLKLENNENEFTASSNYRKSLFVIFKNLHQLPLQVITVKDGVFAHLGTSLEFLAFLTSINNNNNNNNKLIKLANKFSLQNSISSKNIQIDEDKSKQNQFDCGITINSCFIFNNTTISCNNYNNNNGINIACTSLVEHSLLDSNVKIGKNCIVSNLRGVYSTNDNFIDRDIVCDKDFNIIDNTMMQIVPLRQIDKDINITPLQKSSFVVLCIGINDNIKAHYETDTTASINSISWQYFFDIAKVTSKDIWSDNIAYCDHTLWNAKLFPITNITTASNINNSQSMLQVTNINIWMQYLSKPILLQNLLDNDLNCINNWKENPRLSLAELLIYGDAQAMHLWRVYMQVVIQCESFHSTIVSMSSSSPSSSSLTRSSSLIINTFHIIEQSITSISVLVDKISNTINRTLERDISMKDISNLNKHAKIRKHILTSSSTILLLLWCCRLNKGVFDHKLTYEENNLYKSMIHDIYCKINHLQSNLFNISEELNCMYDQILVEFDRLWTNISMNQQVSILTIEYLYELIDINDLLTIVVIIMSNSDMIRVELQPRLIFISAWLLRIFNIAQNTRTNINNISIPNNNTNNNLKENSVIFITAIANELSLLLDKNQINSRLDINLITNVSMKDKHQLGSYVEGSLRLKLEEYAQNLICFQLQNSLQHELDKANISIFDKEIEIETFMNANDLSNIDNKKKEIKEKNKNRKKIIMSKAPVRIDIAGGWSDTPPICYEGVGSVLNVAVDVDGISPVSCVSRFIDDKCIKLHSLELNQSFISSSSSSSSVKSSLLLSDIKENRFKDDEITCRTYNDFINITNDAKCSLLKACLIVLDVLKIDNNDTSYTSNSNNSLSEVLSNAYNGGIEVACLSLLPAGSGMGGSSILAAAILRSIAYLLDKEIDDYRLVFLVSQVEQILKTGGGWQDQIGSIYGSFKLSSTVRDASKLCMLPLEILVEKIHTCDTFNQRFNDRTLLLFTGQQRLARNTLINALRSNAISPLDDRNRDINKDSNRDNVITSLVTGAIQGKNTLLELSTTHIDITDINNNVNASTITTSTSRECDDAIDVIGTILGEYWSLKKMMAKGSEPSYISSIFNYLRPYCKGLSLAGAGGGGYAVIIMNRDISKQYIYDLIKIYISNNQYNDLSDISNIPDINNISVHDVNINNSGIDITEIDTHAAAFAYIGDYL